MADELTDLHDRLALIEGLTRHPGWEVYQDFIRHRINEETRGLLSGSAATLEEYRARAGWVQGAAYALETEKHLRLMIDQREQRIREDAA